MEKKFHVIDKDGNICHWNYSWLGCVVELMEKQSSEPLNGWHISSSITRA